jgi:uncharacterized membrane protein YoaK (UPF0700 family)
MNMFKSYKFDWKQIGIFKISLISIGAIVGAYLSNFVKDYLALFIIIAAISTIYIMYISIKQIK